MIINCTPHPLAIHAAGKIIAIPPSGTAPRCAVARVEADPTDGIPTCRSTMGQVENLPDPVDGVFLIVSGLVLEAARASGRTDLRSPGEAVRDVDGKIVGCRGLCA